VSAGTNGPEDVGVLVVGSGAAGLVAALAAAEQGARVTVVEAAEHLGGTSALSGGRVWIPANGSEANAGDSPEAALRYLTQVFDTRYAPMIEAFVETAPVMGRFVESHSAHRFVACPHYPDYHPELEGATAGGRCLDMEPVRLGDLVPEVSALYTPPGYVPLTHAEWERWRYPDRFDHALLQARQRDGVRTNGVGLMAALLDAVVRRGARVRSRTRLLSVRTDADGRVVGAELEHDGSRRTVDADAVVLASGGFDRDDARRRAMLPPALGVSAGSPGNTGVALDVARELGLQVDNLGEGWWMPMLQIPGESVDDAPYPRSLIRERGTPRQILVDRSGRRFVDEAVPYNELGKAMHRRAPDGSHPHREAFLVFDDGFRRRYPLPGIPPRADLPPWVTTGDTPEDLARRVGVDPDGLDATVRRWNAFCATGADEDFHRGDSVYDRYYGDPDQPGNPNLGPLDEPPYHAVPLVSGTIGSKGGPVTDVDGRTLRADGTVVPGLFAVGNAAAFWTGDGYPGPGATLSVGMTMGYRAGRAVARAPVAVTS